MALAAAVERYEIHHPVLDDPELDTWKAYTARAWPTLVVIDPEGYIVAHLSGEGHADGLAVLIPELIAEHEAKGTLHRGDGPYVAPEPTSGTLRFPGKALFLPAAARGRVRRLGAPTPDPGWSQTPATTAWWSWPRTSRPSWRTFGSGRRATPTVRRRRGPPVQRTAGPGPAARGRRREDRLRRRDRRLRQPPAPRALAGRRNSQHACRKRRPAAAGNRAGPRGRGRGRLRDRAGSRPARRSR